MAVRDPRGDQALAILRGRQQRAVLRVAEVADLQEHAGGDEVVADHGGHPFAAVAHHVVAHRVERMHLQPVLVERLED